MDPHPTPSRASVPRQDPLHLSAAALRAGDADALRTLYDATSARVHGLALRLCGQAHLAEEVTVETYVRAWRRRESFDAERGDFLAWLLAMARSTAFDLLRREQRHGSRIAGADLSHDVAIADERSAASRGAEISERRIVVTRATRELPPEQAAVLSLAFWEGLSHSAIASRLEIPLGTVKTRLRLALSRLRQILRSLEAS